MTKLLIIFLLIIGTILLIMLLAIRFLKRIFTGFFGQPINVSNKVSKNENILYHKDDLTILKGEAGQDNGKPSEK